MRVCIHRGAHEVGGNCVEIESGGESIVLDVGRPLWAGGAEHIPLPDVGTPTAVVVSHGHQDHWGLIEQLDERIPVYCGKATANILREAAFFTKGVDLSPAGFLEHGKPFEVGPFTITPYLMDHSAFDTYALLVETGGKRLFYSADFRATGAKAPLFERLLKNPPAGIDALLLEGTRLPAEGEPEFKPETEKQLAARCAEVISSTKGMVLVSYSSQNIDRLVQLFRAAKACERQFVMDLYTARVAEATENENIPRPGPRWPDVRVYIPKWQRIKVLEAEAFDYVGGDIKKARIYEKELAASPGRFVTKLSRQTLHALAAAGGLAGAHAIWSLWSGYLNDQSGKRLVADLNNHDILLTEIHVSGHAVVSDLVRLAEALHADRLVPIHSAAVHRFKDYFANVELHNDGDWWEV